MTLKTIPQPPIVIAVARLNAITYAYEDRGDPPVATITEVRSYDLVRDDGSVYAAKSIGVVIDLATLDPIGKRWGIVQAEITAAEKGQ